MTKEKTIKEMIPKAYEQIGNKTIMLPMNINKNHTWAIVKTKKEFLNEYNSEKPIIIDLDYTPGQYYVETLRECKDGVLLDDYQDLELSHEQVKELVNFADLIIENEKFLQYKKSNRK